MPQTAKARDAKTNGAKKASEIRKERTRALILREARKAFAKKGYDATAVSDIVKKAGVAQGTFYYHFPDKKSILIELLDDFFGKTKALAAQWAASTDTSAEMGERFVRSLAALLYDNRDLARIVMKEGRSSDPDIRAAVNDTFAFLRRQTEAALHLGMALGVVRPLDARITAIALVGMLREVVFELLDSKEPIDMDHLIKEISALQNFGIRPQQ
jgi:AcrR family transcriptional regulator